MTKVNNNFRNDRGNEFSREVLERLARWHHQRDYDVMSRVSRKIDEFFSNRFNYLECVFNGNIKRIVDMCEKNYSRDSALDVVYAYSTSKDEDIMESCTGDIVDLDTEEVVGRKYVYEEIVSLVDDNIMPVWNLGNYDIYDIETLEVVGRVDTKMLRDIWEELFADRLERLESRNNN